MLLMPEDSLYMKASRELGWPIEKLRFDDDEEPEEEEEAEDEC